MVSWEGFGCSLAYVPMLFRGTGITNHLSNLASRFLFPLFMCARFNPNFLLQHVYAEDCQLDQIITIGTMRDRISWAGMRKERICLMQVHSGLISFYGIHLVHLSTKPDSNQLSSFSSTSTPWKMTISKQLQQ
jgi:hypothetical protein